MHGFICAQVPTPPKIAALRKAWAAQPPAFPECSILTGLGALYGGFDVEQGTDGFMTGFAFPEVLMAIDCVAIYTPSSRCCYGEDVASMAFSTETPHTARYGMFSVWVEE